MENPVNLLGIVLYGLSCIYILKKYRQYTVLFGYISIMQFWALISCFYNDLGIYNAELFQYTEQSYATIRLSLFYLIFNLGFLPVARLIGTSRITRVDYGSARNVFKTGNLRIVLYVAGSILVFYELYWLMSNSVNPLLSVDKLGISEKFGPVESLLARYGVAIAFLLGYFRKKTRGVSIQGMILTLFVVFKLFTGHKFSEPSMLVVSYYVPIFIRALNENSRLKIFRLKYLFYAMLAVITLLSFVYVRYHSWIGGLPAETTRFLADRLIANQGQLWWAVDNDYFKSGVYDKDHWVAEVSAIIMPGSVSSHEVGMQYLMLKILGPEIGFPILEKGYYYTMAYPAILIVTMPYGLALFTQFLAGAFLVMLLFYLNQAVLSRHSVRSTLALLLVMPYMAVLGTGVFAVFLTLGSVGKGAIILGLEFGGTIGRTRENN